MVGVEDDRRDISFQVHQQFYKDLMKKCDNPGKDISKTWPGAAPPISKGACDALPACLKIWQQHKAQLGNVQLFGLTIRFG